MEGHTPDCRTQSEDLQKEITLGKQAMREVEDRLKRHPELPYWDILIQPA
jgi:hypothetical protein